MNGIHVFCIIILMACRKDSYILLDCGYGVAGQLVRLYGEEKSSDILRNLKAIFVSHGHADHHAVSVKHVIN